MSGRIAIIGGGLAGTACAHVLQQCGFTCHIFEAGPTLASGASGNPRAIYNPRLSALRDEVSDFYSAGFAAARSTFSQLRDIDFHPCGSLHLITNEAKQKRFEKTSVNWGWPEDHMQWLNKEEASEIAGINLEFLALYLPDSGYVAPSELCAAYAEKATIYLNTPVTHLEQSEEGWRVNDEKYDAVILANGVHAADFTITDWFPVYTVRGQVIELEATETSSNLKCNLNFRGYISPASENGRHVAGSTFHKDIKHTETTRADSREILDHLEKAVPAIDAEQVMDARASLRTSSQDYLPLIGPVPDRQTQEPIPNLYVTTAHGSHGSVTSLAGAHVLAAYLTGGSVPHYASCVDSVRFLQRRAKGKS